MGVVLQRAVIITTLLTAGLAVLWTHAEQLLLLCKQDPEISRAAAQFIRHLIPALWCSGLTEAFKRWAAAGGGVWGGVAACGQVGGVGGDELVAGRRAGGWVGGHGCLAGRSPGSASCCAVPSAPRRHGAGLAVGFSASGRQLQGHWPRGCSGATGAKLRCGCGGCRYLMVQGTS